MSTYLNTSHKIISSLLLTSINIYTMKQICLTHQPLYMQRPPEVVMAVNKTYDDIKNEACRWYFNGTNNYYLCNTDDTKLLRVIINKHPEKKDFYILDVGAGQHDWSSSMFYYLHHKLFLKQKLPTDIKITIISVTGENDCDQNIVTDTITKKTFPSVKIECIEEELSQRGITCLFDLIVSRWTLRHLVDPTGTFEQLYNRLNPTDGLLLADGFFINLPNSPFSKNYNENIFSLLSNTGAPFLMEPYDLNRSCDQFTIQRTSTDKLHLPLIYQQMTSILINYQCNAQKVIAFIPSSLTWNNDPKKQTIEYTYPGAQSSRKKYYYYCKDMRLIDWFLQSKLITTYTAIKDSDEDSN